MKAGWEARFVFITDEDVDAAETFEAMTEVLSEAVGHDRWAGLLFEGLGEATVAMIEEDIASHDGA